MGRVIYMHDETRQRTLFSGMREEEGKKEREKRQ